MKIIRGACWLVGLALTAGAGCGADDQGKPQFVVPPDVGGATSAKSVTIAIAPNATAAGKDGYGANPMDVQSGTTVVWINNDVVPHTVTADDGHFDSGTIAPGQKWSYTFLAPGVFPYHDATQAPAAMTGKIVVPGAVVTPLKPVLVPSVKPLPPATNPKGGVLITPKATISN